jgi:hypothetical protein
MFIPRYLDSLRFLVLMMLLAGCRKAESLDVLNDLPPEQKQFCQIVSKGNLSDAIGSLGSSGRFTAWYGQGSVHLRDDGKILGIIFSPTCPDSNSPIALEDETGVPAEGSLGYTLQASDFSHGMMISGKFNPSSSHNGDEPLTAQLRLISPGHFSQHSLTALREAPASANSPATSQPSRVSVVPAAFRKSSSTNAMPEQETQLCRLFDEFNHWQPPAGSSNPIKAANAPPIKEPDWKGKMHAIMGDSGAFTNWKARVWGAEYHPDLGRRLVISGKSFVVRFTVMSR